MRNDEETLTQDEPTAHASKDVASGIPESRERHGEGEAPNAGDIRNLGLLGKEEATKRVLGES